MKDLLSDEAIITDSDGHTEWITGSRLVVDVEDDASVTVDGADGMQLRVANGEIHCESAEQINITGEGGGDIVFEQNGAGLAVLADGTVRLFGNQVSINARDGDVAFNGPVDYEVPAGNEPTSAPEAKPKAAEAVADLEETAEQRDDLCDDRECKWIHKGIQGDWVPDFIGGGDSIDPADAVAVTRLLFDESRQDDLARPVFRLPVREAKCLIESVAAIESATDRARVIRAIYTRINRADPYAAWFALAPIAATQVVKALWRTDHAAQMPAAWFDELARVVQEGFADGNLAVFRSQFGAYAVYRNEGADGLPTFAENELGQGREQYFDLIQGYRAQDKALLAARRGQDAEVRDQYGYSLNLLAAYEQGEAVLQPIYDAEITVSYGGATPLHYDFPVRYLSEQIREAFGWGREITVSVGDALNELRAAANIIGYESTATDVFGTVYEFAGDDIGDYGQRMAWIREMATEVVETRFGRGQSYIAAFNRRLLN